MIGFRVRNTFVSKFANFARLYFPCPDQNLVYNANCPLNALEKSMVQFRVREYQEYPSLLAICVAYMFEQVIERWTENVIFCLFEKTSAIYKLPMLWLLSSYQYAKLNGKDRVYSFFE